MPAALARSQLKRLPEYIATGQRNAAYPDGAAGRTCRASRRRTSRADRTSTLLRVPGPPRSGGSSASATSSRPPSGMRSAKTLLARGRRLSSCGTPSRRRPSRSSRTVSGSGAGSRGRSRRRAATSRYDVADYPEATAMLDSSLVHLRHAPPDLRPADRADRGLRGRRSARSWRIPSASCDAHRGPPPPIPA